MEKFNSEKEIEKFIDDIIDAKRNSSLICFVGAGVSISQGYPNWEQYVNQLINYWIYHLRDLVNLEETRENNFKIDDMNILQDLLVSRMSPKRKVDMVNYIVKKYCRGEDDSISEEIYKNHVLDFEKFIFSEAYPIATENDVLDNLVNLDATFITTNYDSQIENSLRRNLEINPIIHKNISEIEGRILPGQVIHLHGTPESDYKYFISSSKSYMNMYYKKDDYRDKIIELFKGKDKTVIVFIGCSMEEDEVLNLLDIKETTTEFYALMKYTGAAYSEEQKNNFLKEYYREEQNVNIVWYGDQYGDLPSFIELMIENIRDKEESKFDIQKIRGVLLGE